MIRPCSSRSRAWSPRILTRSNEGRRRPLPVKGEGAVVLFLVRALDVPTPGPGLAAAALDELLEPLGVGLDLVVVDADGGTGLLHQALGLPVDLDHDARSRV